MTNGRQALHVKKLDRSLDPLLRNLCFFYFMIRGLQGTGSCNFKQGYLLSSLDNVYTSKTPCMAMYERARKR